MKMQNKIFRVLLPMVLVISLPTLTPAQQKLAQTGFQFLSVGTDARATGMGNALVTQDGSISALFYNPAGMASIDHLIAGGINQHTWLADVDYISGAFSLSPKQGRFGVLGISYLAVNYGTFYGTQVAENEQGYEETGTFTPTSAAYGAAYAIQLSDKFMIGGQLKYVYQDLGTSIIPVGRDLPVDGEEIETTKKAYTKGLFAVDFGTIYHTGLKSLVFGMAVRNFSQEVKYEYEGFQLPLTFKIGFAIDALDFISDDSPNHQLVISFDAIHPRSYPEYISWGGEYRLLNTLALRAGYVTNSIEYGPTVGFGVQKFGLKFDYSYTPYERFDAVQRVSFQFHL